MKNFNVFEEIRNTLTMKEVAEAYGFKAGRSDMVLCPFHGEKSASMKLYKDHYHCFGCGHHGDAVKFVATYLNLTPLQAAKRISDDFGLHFFA